MILLHSALRFEVKHASSVFTPDSWVSLAHSVIMKPTIQGTFEVLVEVPFGRSLETFKLNLELAMKGSSQRAG